VTTPDEIVLGEVVGVFGFRGELRVHLHDRESTTLREVRPVVLVMPDGSRRPTRMRVRAGAGKRILGTADGIASEDAARACIGAQIVIARSELPAPAAGEFYVHDLIGLAVQDDGGNVLGTLADVVPGAVDVWVVALPDGDDAFLVATKEAVRSIEPARGRIVVDPAALSTGA
jgi:16S rRNA processing protein RimM